MIYLSIMKYIINESQSELLHLLRRWGGKENDELMFDIIYEGFDIFNPCDFPTVESYFNSLIDNSSRTFLYHWFDSSYEKFDVLLNIIETKMREGYRSMIYHHYYDNLGDC